MTTPPPAARPFTIAVPDSVLEDLQTRLRNTRKDPHEFDTNGKFYGQDAKKQQELLEYWQSGYDWRVFEAQLNSFDNFKMAVQGLDIHFIHKKSPRADAIPLLMVHGWPGSVWEFHKIIPLLTNPSSNKDPAFHLICPSIPGYGFSDAPKTCGTSIEVVAHMFQELMINLGYSQYVAQGGDWGGLITKLMALRYPQSCVILHQNVAVIPTMNVPFGLKLRVIMCASPRWRRMMFSKKTQAGFVRSMEYALTGSAYMLTHTTVPHTLGNALMDSPAGLLSWICEKLEVWSDCRDGGLFNVHSKDEILTNVMIYWVTSTITSSMRLYYETFPFGKHSSDAVARIKDGYVKVPTGVSTFPNEIIALPPNWLYYGYNIVQLKQHDKGGHFAAWEEPAVLAEDISNLLKRMPFAKACKLGKRRKAPK